MAILILLNEVLKSSLELRKTTINKVAKECGIPVSVLHGWVNGTLPSAKNLHLIYVLSKYFQLSIEELLFNRKDLQSSNKVLFSAKFENCGEEFVIRIEKGQNEK